MISLPRHLSFINLTTPEWRLEWFEYFHEAFEFFFEQMDEAGAVVIMAAGNRGYNSETGKPDYYLSERTPVDLVTDASPYISVGATYHDGSIAEFTTPPGTPGPDSDPDDPTISIWAQGVGVYTCVPVDLDPDDPMEERTGTSYSSPIVVSL